MITDQQIAIHLIRFYFVSFYQSMKYVAKNKNRKKEKRKEIDQHFFPKL